MAARIGISRETLRVMVNGEREIYWFELEKNALDLKVPVKRLLMEDLEERESRDLIVRHVAYSLPTQHSKPNQQKSKGRLP
ncbi:hypothetical protein CBW65_17920 [Tumebacillus avium]|uniref:HTH cro/C1-type domain-containing protein n=2 Tax=Tumebacillus avium TaxID=1903704 RepID=A0A1Y0IRJ1_9BACL|nr:hypothetical protein CBW65_17920 [Tumebacillus avium]